MRQGHILFLTNGLISLLLWAGIFYTQAGVSGGDMAIVIFNFIVGFLHILGTAIFNKYSGYRICGGTLSVVLFQILELAILIN